MVLKSFFDKHYYCHHWFGYVEYFAIKPEHLQDPNIIPNKKQKKIRGEIINEYHSSKP